MRKNVETVMQYWYNHKPCNRFHSISTDGTLVFSYSTVMLYTRGKHWILNDSKYSCTTSCQQSGIREFLSSHNIKYIPSSQMGTLINKVTV